jgi:hypothetical protein
VFTKENVYKTAKETTVMSKVGFMTTHLTTFAKMNSVNMHYRKDIIHHVTDIN